MSKLIESLRLLDRSELQAFSRYIHSPYFCQHQETIHLFEFLAPYFPDFELDLFHTYAPHYAKGGLSRGRLNVLKSYLLGHLQNFLVLERQKKDPIRQKTILAEILQERGQFQEAKKQLDQAQKDLLENSFLDSSNFLAELHIQESLLDIYLKMENRGSSLPVQELLHALDQLYLGYSGKYLMTAWTLKRILGQDFPDDKWKLYQEFSQVLSIPPHPISRMYYCLLQLFQGHDIDQNREELRQLLETHDQRMSRTELTNVYGYLQNHYNQCMLKGEAGAVRHLFEGYQKMVENHLVFDQGEYSGNLIRNIIVVGCRLGELTWTESFLARHKPQIEKEIGGNAYRYGLAYLYFYRTEYSKSLQLLQHLQFVDTFYRVGHQFLLLRIYYELNDFESLTLVSATFRRYLNRTQQISERQKGQYRNFMSILHKLIRVKENGSNPSKLKRIADLLEEYQEVTDRPWLISKLDELSSAK